MKLTIKFFDNIDWSIYATLQTLYIIIIMKIFTVNLDIKSLIFASLLSMIEGDLISRLIYTFFISIMIWSHNPHLIKNTITSLIAILIIYNIPVNNRIQQFILKNKKILNFFKLLIGLWFLLIVIFLWKSQQTNTIRITST